MTRADNILLLMDWEIGLIWDLSIRDIQRRLTSNGVTSTGAYYYNATILSQIARLEKKRMRNALPIGCFASGRLIMKNFIILSAGSMIATVRLQIAISLYFGLVEESNREIVYRNLINDIKYPPCFTIQRSYLSYRYSSSASRKPDILRHSTKQIQNMTSGYGWHWFMSQSVSTNRMPMIQSSITTIMPQGLMKSLKAV